MIFLISYEYRRTETQKNPDELRHKESTLELDNSNIYSQVQERGKSSNCCQTHTHCCAFPSVMFASSLSGIRNIIIDKPTFTSSENEIILDSPSLTVQV